MKLFISSILILMSCSSSFASASWMQFIDDVYYFQGKASVHDGDTIYIKNTPIRLTNIDAPELKQICFDHSIKEFPERRAMLKYRTRCGLMSKAFLKSFIDGKDIACQSAKIDRYGRYLAECHLGNLNLNSLMIESGWAVAYFTDSHQDLEKDARENKKGIWSLLFTSPHTWRANYALYQQQSKK